jgi:hypothetical protein
LQLHKGWWDIWKHLDNRDVEWSIEVGEEVSRRIVNAEFG